MKQRNVQEQFNRTLKTLLPNSQQKSVLIAVSGGVDSMVLCHLCLHLPAEQKPQRIVVAHVNHQLRIQSTIEERLVAEFCRRNGITCFFKKWSTATHPKAGLEAAARQMRYQFFEQLMKEETIDFLMTGHHGDDQVETMLMKLTRGSDLAGVAGMKYVRIFAEKLHVRPLLRFEKEELREFAQQRNIPFLEDESNETAVFQRNRFRSDIVPKLKQENRQLIEHVHATSSQLNDVLALVMPLLAQTFAQLFTETKTGWEVSCNELKQLNAPLQRQVVRYLITAILAKRNSYISHKLADELLYLVHHPKPQLQLDLGDGWRAIRSYDCLAISQHARKKADGTLRSDERVVIELPTSEQCYVLSENETVTVSTKPSESKQDKLFSFTVDASEFPLTIRHRQTKDRLLIQREPLRHQKLKNWFINEKIPAAKREKIWVVCNHKGVIIAILDYRKPCLLLNGQETGKINIEYKKTEVQYYANK